MHIPLSTFASENLVSRDGFGSPVPRQPPHLHAQAESGAYLRVYSRVPRWRPFIYLNCNMYAIGSVPSLSGHATAYRWRSLPRVCRHRASKPKGSSMDQLVCASLSHTHYWNEVGMLKVPYIFTSRIDTFSGYKYLRVLATFLQYGRLASIRPSYQEAGEVSGRDLKILRGRISTVPWSSKTCILSILIQRGVSFCFFIVAVDNNPLQCRTTITTTQNNILHSTIEQPRTTIPVQQSSTKLEYNEYCITVLKQVCSYSYYYYYNV